MMFQEIIIAYSDNHTERKFLTSGIYRREVCWKLTDFSEEHIASIFRVDK
jgi:hypothetical protein